MDQVTLVDARFAAGTKLLGRFSAAGIVVRAAAWFKPLDDDRWFFYIATSLVDELGSLNAIRRVQPLVLEVDTLGVLASRIWLVGAGHRVAREIDEIRRHTPESGPIVRESIPFNDVVAETLYIYPRHSAELTLYGLVFSGDSSGALHLSFEPHGPHCVMTVGEGEGRVEYPGQTGIDRVVAVPDDARVEKDKRGVTVLAWSHRGRRQESTANEVFSLAELGLHGFRVVREPTPISAQGVSA